MAGVRLGRDGTGFDNDAGFRQSINDLRVAAGCEARSVKTLNPTKETEL
jgi:hypothetical protein